jgi:hypothetical protein
LPDKWKESIIVSIYKNFIKIDCSNYHGISMISTSYNSLSNVILSKISLHIDEIIGDH